MTARPSWPRWMHKQRDAGTAHTLPDSLHIRHEENCLYPENPSNLIRDVTYGTTFSAQLLLSTQHSISSVSLTPYVAVLDVPGKDIDRSFLFVVPRTMGCSWVPVSKQRFDNARDAHFSPVARFRRFKSLPCFSTARTSSRPYTHSEARRWHAEGATWAQYVSLYVEENHHLPMIFHVSTTRTGWP